MVKPDYVITFIGNDTVGKTSIVNRLKYGTYEPHYHYTQGADEVIIPQFKVKDGFVRLLICDTGGHHIQHQIIQKFIAKADAIVIVYDITKKKSFDNLPVWIKMALKNPKEDIMDVNKNSSTEDSDSSVVNEDRVMMIVGNKTDLSCRVVPEQKIKEIALLNGISLHEEVSAKLNTNVDLAFQKLVETLIQRKKPRTKIFQDKTKRSLCTLL